MSGVLPWHEKVLLPLLGEKVCFLVIGGYAVNFYGYVRPTGDMDIWLRPDEINKAAFISMLEKAGISEASRAHIARLDFTSSNAFHIGQEPFRFDFLTRIAGLDFDEAWKSRETMRYGNLEIPVISREHLILSKMSSSRTQDKLDVEELQKLLK